jgi:hypothetical protein
MKAYETQRPFGSIWHPVSAEFTGLVTKGADIQRPLGSIWQPSLVGNGLEAGVEAGIQRPFGSMWQPVLLQTPTRKLQACPKRSGIPIPLEVPAGWVLPCRGPAEAQGAISRAASRRRTTVVRRGEV